MSAAYTTGDVARLLGVSADTVRRHWPEWHRSKGFPQPLPLLAGARSLLRWDAATVDLWRTRPMTPGEGSVADIDTTDWALVARLRGAALDAGRDPDFVSA